MSDWIDAGNAGDSQDATTKGIIIAAIFFGILAVVVFVILPLLF